MAERAMLLLTGQQKNESGEESVTESCLMADYYEREKGFYILYEETEPDTGDTTKNRIKWKDSQLEITKGGSIHCRMIFETGHTHKTDYITPYGTLSLEVTTRKVEILRQQNQLKIQLDYTLTSDSQFLSDCILTLCLLLSEKYQANISEKS